MHSPFCKWLHRAHLPPAAKTQQPVRDASAQGIPFKAGHKGIPYLGSSRIPHSQQVFTINHTVCTIWAQQNNPIC